MQSNEPASPFRERDRIRDLVVRDFLKGRGLEIGAGVTPQRLPPGASCRLYDLRTTAELTSLFGQTPANEAAGLDRIPIDFPDGADFLVAHNVLEHAPDPIGTLIQWHRLVKPEWSRRLVVPGQERLPRRGAPRTAVLASARRPPAR